MVWRPTDAGPRNIRELYHWVRRELVSVGQEVGNGGGPGVDDHDDLTNVTPNQHHNQVHDFLGSDHSNIPATFPPEEHDLDTHGDVDIDSPTNGEQLVFRDGQWENVALDPLAEKPAGEPIVIIAHGQSNVFGSFEPPRSEGGTGGGLTPGLIVSNPRVFYWQSAGTYSVPTDWEWQTVDPYGAEHPDFQGPFRLLSWQGHAQDGRAGMAYVMADMLQKVTGRDVYVYQYGAGGVSIDSWLTTGTGARGVIENNYGAVAKATPEIDNRPADIVIWMHGEANTTDRDIDTYADNVETIRNWFEADGYAEAEKTQWVVYDINEAYDAERETANSNGREHVRAGIARLGNFAHHVVSDGIPDVGDDVHYTADAHIPLGLNGAAKILAGPVTGREQQSYWYINSSGRLSPVGGLSLDLIVGDIRARDDLGGTGSANLSVNQNGKLIRDVAVTTLSATITTDNSWSTVSTVPVTAARWFKAFIKSERVDDPVNNPDYYLGEFNGLVYLDGNGDCVADEDRISEVGRTQLNFRLQPSGSDVLVQVRGRNNQDWSWELDITEGGYL